MSVSLPCPRLVTGRYSCNETLPKFIHFTRPTVFSLSSPCTSIYVSVRFLACSFFFLLHFRLLFVVGVVFVDGPAEIPTSAKSTAQRWQHVMASVFDRSVRPHPILIIIFLNWCWYFCLVKKGRTHRKKKTKKKKVKRNVWMGVYACALNGFFWKKKIYSLSPLSAVLCFWRGEKETTQNDEDSR